MSPQPRSGCGTAHSLSLHPAAVHAAVAAANAADDAPTDARHAARLTLQPQYPTVLASLALHLVRPAAQQSVSPLSHTGHHGCRLVGSSTKQLPWVSDSDKLASSADGSQPVKLLLDSTTLLKKHTVTMRRQRRRTQ